MGVLRQGVPGRVCGPAHRSSTRCHAAFKRTDIGMVTAEFAVVTLAVVVVAAMMIAAVAVAMAEVRVHEAARAGARAAARGDPEAVIVAAALRSAPGSRVAVAKSDEAVVVRVSSRVQWFPGLALAGPAVTATSIADREPT